MTSQKPILVVDDDADIRETVADVLDHLGYEVITAENGRVALDLLRSGPPPALILLDLMMPDMDGWEFLNELRSRPPFESVPVVILSAMDRARGPAEAGYLRKPFDLDDLLSVVERYARGG